MITWEILNERKHMLYIKSILGIIPIILLAAAFIQIARTMISMQKEIDFLYEGLASIADHQVLLSNVFLIDKGFSEEGTDISEEQKIKSHEEFITIYEYLSKNNIPTKMKSREDLLRFFEHLQKKKNQKPPKKH